MGQRRVVADMWGALVFGHGRFQLIDPAFKVVDAILQVSQPACCALRHRCGRNRRVAWRTI